MFASSWSQQLSLWLAILFPNTLPSMLLSPSIPSASPMVTTMSLLLTLDPTSCPMVLPFTCSGSVHHIVSLSTSNGVEPYCKQVIILLRALVQDERVEDCWSEPRNFGTILFIINSNINSGSCGREDGKAHKVIV